MDGAAFPAIASLLLFAIASISSSQSQQTPTSLTKTASAAHNHMLAQQGAQTPAPAPTAPAIAAVLLQSNSAVIQQSHSPAESVASTDSYSSHSAAQQKPPRTKLQSHRNSSNTRTRH